MSTFRRGRIAVLGAGLAGLSAADILAARGLSPIVLEKMPATGGLSATVENGGLRFDYGPHRFHTKNPAILERVSAALGGGLLRLERQSRIRMLDRYFRYPLDLSDVLRKMPVASGAAMLASYGLARLKRAVAPSADLNFEDWVVSRFGRKLFDVYFGPYTAKLWGCRPSSLSSDWASQRISVPGLSGLIRDAFFPGSTGSRSLVSTFHYPRGGIGRISDALAARVRSSGGRILTGTAPGSIQLLEDGYRIGLEGSELDVDWIVNSIPLTEYVRLLGPALTDDARSAASELRFRAIVFVALQLSSRSAARDHWIYAAEDLYAFNRLSIPENFDPAMSGPGGQVTFEFSCQEGDATWNASDDLVRGSVEGGVRLGLFREEEVLGSTVTRQPHAYPIYDIGYEEKRRNVLDALQALPRSVTCGRQGLFRYNNMDHSIEMGEYAAMEALGEGSVRERFDWTRNTWVDG
jgi:protoporphyrinogen oxidase